MAQVQIEGTLPKAFGLTKRELKAFATQLADASSRRIGIPFNDISVILQDDAFSAEVHLAINGVEGPTDVITQRYDPIPGEKAGVYGEIYVNCARALHSAPHSQNWNPTKELLLYIAHGMDHLSGADDLTPAQYQTMRRRELSWLKSVEKRSDLVR